MATGDIKNNLKKLQGSLKTVKYEKDLDIESISKGIATAYLPIYHYLFVDYSRHLAEKISELNIELQGKSDLRFIESVYKVLREIFSYKPSITKDQFFSKSFGERKIIMTTEIVNMVAKKHKSLAPKPRVKVNLSINSSASANTSKLGNRPTSAPTNVSTNMQDVKKQDAKPMKHKQTNIVPVLPQVVNEVMEPSNNTHAATTLSMAPPITIPGITINLKKIADSYHPGDYPCGPGAQSDQTSVEIVSLQSNEDSEYPEHSNSSNTVRPIDIVKTPGRPLVESHRNNLSMQHTLQSSPVSQQNVQQTLSIDVQQQLAHLVQTITTLNEKVSGIEGRVAAMEGLISMQQRDQNKQGVTGLQDLENLTARLTLAENKITLIESKFSNAATTKAYNASAYQSEPLNVASNLENVNLQSAISSKPFSPERHFEQQYSNGHDSPDKENKKPGIPVQSGSDAGFSDSLENMSPIPKAVHRTATLQSTGSPEGDRPLTKDNYKPAHQCSTPTDTTTDNGTLSKYEQAERIRSMLKQTEDMLHIQVDSPVAK